MERRLAAIMAADVVGYARLVRADEEGTIAALKSLRSAHIDPKIAEHHGRTVKLMGDGLLAEFPSVVDAVRAAVESQQAVAEHNAGLPADGRIEFRVGINLGDVVIDGDDIQGDGVNVAARLEGLAEAGGVCISGSVYEQIRDRMDLAFEDLGEQAVKNIDRPVRVWQWTGTPSAAVDPQPSDAPSQLPDKPSVAVLPFENMSGDVEQDYFADGITEDIITALSRFHWMFVTARNSSFAYKGKSMDIRQVSQELLVRYVLEGSIRKSGDRVRITAQLIDGASGNHIWADRYDRKLDDIFELQDEITARIAAAMQPVLYAAEGARAELKNPERMDAWDLFLRARNLAHVGTKETNEEAQAIARRALSMDANSAGALKVLANCLYHQVISGWTTRRGRAFAEAMEVAERAVRVDPDDAEARQILGLVYLGYSRHGEALAELQTAVELNPNYAQGYVSLGICYNYLGEPEKALPLFEKAIEISPRDLNLTMWRCTQSLGHILAGDFGRAIEDAKFSAIRKDYWAPSRWYWAASAALAGEPGEVDEARSEVLRLNPDFSINGLRKAHPFSRDQDFEILADGLRKAGLPE
ncbi:MAG: adenylate/guanylate cyclase domain-containing protein [Alphaproteobacteria bacterium]|nr:adenylate/guanylate cyclase domain-containing protein [Alphaproteobacteria bacterium]